MEIFIGMLALIGYIAVQDHPQEFAAFKTQATEVIIIDYNDDTNLTDFTVGGYEFSLDIQDLDYSKLNK